MLAEPACCADTRAPVRGDLRYQRICCVRRGFGFDMRRHGMLQMTKADVAFAAPPITHFPT